MYYKGERMEGPSSPYTDFHGHGKAIRRELRRRIPAAGKVRVLDVGTGFGQNAAFLVDYLSKNSEIWTVDPSEEVLANAKTSLGEKTTSRIRFVRASADDLDFPDEFFDFIVSVMVMHHLEDPRLALEELARVLKSGGRLLIVDYKPEASHELEFQTRHREKDFFEPRVIGKFARRAGLTPKVEEFPLWYLVGARK